MSTRSIVRVFSGPDEICTIYRHHDGYPSAMGADMVRIVGQRRIVNGFTVKKQIVEWSERIILSTISRHPEPMVPQRGIDFGQGQEIDVPVARR